MGEVLGSLQIPPPLWRLAFLGHGHPGLMPSSPSHAAAWPEAKGARCSQAWAAPSHGAPDQSEPRALSLCSVGWILLVEQGLPFVPRH